MKIFLQSAEITLKTLVLVEGTMVFVLTTFLSFGEVIDYPKKAELSEITVPLTGSTMESMNPNTTMLGSPILPEYFV